MIKTEFIIQSIQAAKKARTLAQMFGQAHEWTRPAGVYRKVPTVIRVLEYVKAHARI
ncbi:hypothetical protein PSCICM_09610 [Pseudomonas cichorii]|uniref:Uncharacterized protein n=1 Tax=Pseudomonas cichorii TaxID=36746 RepID=A0ABQ1DPS8_PSECI|nr:hypothetical protein PSCICM_09610 [Pseudomonas cichorii]GFM92974.1 hypothetical protein PSCICP_29460 [Pseudomonas cichorii]